MQITPDDSAGAMNKKCPQRLVAFFRRVHKYLPVTTRVLARNEAKPRGKMTTIFKFSSFANRGNSRGSLLPYIFNFGKVLTNFGLPENNINFFIKKCLYDVRDR